MPRVIRDPDDHQEAPTRLLARSLLREVCPWLYGEADAPCPPIIAARPWQVRWTPATIRAALQTFVATYHRVPTRMDWNVSRQYNLPSLSTIKTVYGGLAAAYKDVGLTPPVSMSSTPPSPASQREGQHARALHKRRERAECNHA